jgi:uncharacterized protein (TIGR03437 family)
MRLLFLILFGAISPLAAQFSNLATDDHGTRVWFSSALQQRGANQNQLSKIFSADLQGNIQLLAQSTTGNDSNSIFTSPEVSADGAVLSYEALYDCPVDMVCRAGVAEEGIVSGKSGPLTLPGIFHLSRNGRYIAWEGYDYFGPTNQIELIDLTTAQHYPILVSDYQLTTGGGGQVTSNGAILALDEGFLWLFRKDGSAQALASVNFEIPSSGQGFGFSRRAAIDDLEDKIIYQETLNFCALDLTSPSNNLLSSTLLFSPRPCTLESFSADGTTVLFVSSDNFGEGNPSGLAQAWTLDTNSKSVQPVTHDAAGIAEATLSGDGRIVWAVTFAGRMIRVDRTTGAMEEVIPQTTIIDQDPLNFPLIVAPGALVHLTGRGLAPRFTASTVPLLTSLNGVQLFADGRPLPLVSVSPSDIVFQVPWEMQGTSTLTLATTLSPFEEQLSRGLQVRPSAPSFLSTSDGSPIIAHQDFHGLVSQNDPARPDEILHFYMTGLGAVTPPVATGEPSPSKPLSKIRDKLFAFWQGGSPIFNFPSSPKLLFAGLAPGLVGIEQVDVQVPHETPAQLELSIQSVTGGNAVADFPVSQF